MNAKAVQVRTRTVVPGYVSEWSGWVALDHVRDAIRELMELPETTVRLQIQAAEHEYRFLPNPALDALRAMYAAFFGRETSTERWRACEMARAVFRSEDGR